MRRFEYHRAETLEQASRLLTELGDDSFLFAGGTDLLVEIRERLRRVRNVIDIKQIPGLADITYDETRGLTFGALVTVGRLERLPLVCQRYPNLRAAFASLGSIQVRNRATVVGNICRASPSADTIPPLIADGAFVHIYSRTNMRVDPACRVLHRPGQERARQGRDRHRHHRAAGTPTTAGKAYLKHGRRKAMELSTVGVAVSLTMEDGLCNDIRIALGAVGATVLRAPEAEAMLRGTSLDAATVKNAANKAMEECTPISNVRASADYRRDMVGVLTGRAIKQALEAFA
jgi:CO/xanthine dehydrogenase FAD-binding subunit